jgi:hypothetical protein
MQSADPLGLNPQLLPIRLSVMLATVVAVP